MAGDVTTFEPANTLQIRINKKVTDSGEEMRLTEERFDEETLWLVNLSCSILSHINGWLAHDLIVQPSRYNQGSLISGFVVRNLAIL